MKKLIVMFPTLAGIMWGATGVFTRILDSYGMNSATILETRMLFGVVILGLGCLVVDRSLLKIHKKDFWLLAGGGILGNFGLSYFYTEAINQLSMAFAAVLLCTFPVFVMLLSAVLFRERITTKKVGCMALAFAGCVLVSGFLEGAAEENVSSGGVGIGEGVGIGGIGGEAGDSWPVLGVAIGVLAAFCYALYSIFSKAAKERGYSSITITFYFMFMVMILLVPMTDWGMMAEYIREAPVQNGLFLLGHCLDAAVLPYVIYTFSLAYVDAGKASVLASSEPVAAMVLGYLFFDEVPTVLMLAGMGLTLLAIIILSLPERE